MWAVTADECRRIEQRVARRAGVSLSNFMERAGRALAQTCGSEKGKRVLILAGRGKNGGDGFFCAGFLKKAGVSVQVLYAGEPADEDACRAKEMFLAQGGEARLISAVDRESRELGEQADVVVDALLGIGLSRPVSGVYKELIEWANGLPARKIAADIPSGLHADDGKIMGTVFRAEETVTFFARKKGMVLPSGREVCGRITCCFLDIPEEMISEAARKENVRVYTGSPELAAGVISPRSPFSHKGDFGRVLIIAGSRGYTGAAWLASMAAVRGGAGVVSCGVPESVYPIVAASLHSPVVFPLPDDGQGRLAACAEEEILRRVGKCDACLMGPGLSVSEALPGLVEKVVRTCAAPLVLDADALNALAGRTEILRAAAGPVVLTPHGGEFARLCGESPDREERSGRYIHKAAEFARTYGVNVVHKGHVTAVAAPDGRLYLNNNGNPGMAKGGSGDVLAGLILALLGQRAEPFFAASAAVYLHGAAGDAASRRYSERTMAPEDLLDALAADIS